MLSPHELLVELDNEVQVGVREGWRGPSASAGKKIYFALTAVLAASAALAFLILCGAAIRGTRGLTSRFLSSNKGFTCDDQSSGGIDDGPHGRQSNTRGANSPSNGPDRNDEYLPPSTVTEETHYGYANVQPSMRSPVGRMQAGAEGGKGEGNYEVMVGSIQRPSPRRPGASRVVPLLFQDTASGHKSTESATVENRSEYWRNESRIRRGAKWEEYGLIKVYQPASPSDYRPPIPLTWSNRLVYLPPPNQAGTLESNTTSQADDDTGSSEHRARGRWHRLRRALRSLFRSLSGSSPGQDSSGRE